MNVIDSLELLAALAEEADALPVAQDARALLERVREGRFFVACLGQFKRGKSTLINALLGEELLPSGVAPVTSVVTVVRWGEPRARVRIAHNEWREIGVAELVEFVSEKENPRNQKGVTGVEVFCRSPFLERGLCLVDTPGIGSVFEGNTEETESFVPHIDAAIIVLGGDPPISGDELTLVKGVAERVRHLLFLLNKADRLSEAERREAIDFTRTVLREELGSGEPRVFEVSALERLRRTGPERDWAEFEARLDELARDGGMELVRLFNEKRERFVADALPEVTRQLDERLAASPARRGPGFRSFAIAQAQDITKPVVSAWMDQEHLVAEREFAAVSERFVAHANTFLDGLSASGQLPRDTMPSRLVPETGLRARSRYYFASLVTLVTPPFWLWTADWFRSEQGARAAARRAGLSFAKQLLEVNANRVVGDFDDRITESRRSVEGALLTLDEQARRLSELSSSAHA